MGDFLPYKAEYAKSDRSSCKGCKTKIAKETLRIAAVVQSPHFDGVMPKWYHYICFFAKQKPKAVGDIENFENLKWNDQELVREKVASIASSAPVNGDAGSKKKATKRGAGGGKKGGKSNNLLFNCELAKSNRSTCRGCHETIIKGELRVSKMDYESDEGRRYGGLPLWHHLDCFVKLRSDLEFWEAGTNLNGYNSLGKEDQDKLKTSLPEIKPVVKKEGDEVDGESAPKKVKAEPVDKKEIKALKEQTDTLQKYTQFLKTLNRPQLADIMEHNKQPVQEASKNTELLADAMLFGWPKTCKKCNNGKFEYSSLEGGYKCHGNISEWLQCDNVLREPKRRVFEIPPSFEEKFASINYKPKTGTRIIRTEERSVVLNPGPSTSSDPKVKSERVLPLKNMEFVILGKTETPKDELKKEIVKMGGKVTTKVHSKLAAVISTKEEVEKKNKRMQDVEDANIQVVPEVFLQESMAGNAIENIAKLNMANWGSDAKKRLAGIESLKSGSLGKSAFSKSGKSSKVTLKVKGGSAVDPESGMEDDAHVYCIGKDIHSAVLSLTDVVKGRNKFYRIQVLESNNKNKYWVFRAWGRIGTTIGGTKLDKFPSLNEAVKLFKFKYEEETGNKWENRRNFKKVPGGMVPMDLDFGVDECDSVRLNTESALESKLPEPVQDLIALLFNVDTMKKVMLEFELDLEKMPLGKISKKQIQAAYGVLSEVQKVLDGEDNKFKVLEATNRFYTLIPHDFGINQAPLLDNLDLIKNKMDMLESLLEMEIAYSMMKSTGEEDGSVHPVDQHYQKLNAEIHPLPKDTEEFAILEKYVKNTHAATHSYYSLKVEEIFKVQRQGEEKRFKPFRKLHNRKLLWHGSRLTNFAGILSQGLRIAPPEAPSTGYMFGKGVYFADMVSKSANYCSTSSSNNIGLMLLCEVALGDMYERTQAEYVEKLPAGKHSCKGVGTTWPDPEEKHVLDDGVEVPFGKPTTKLERHETSLLYNEYIVYDVAQIKARYLFRMKFEYQY